MTSGFLAPGTLRSGGQAGVCLPSKEHTPFTLKLRASRDGAPSRGDALHLKTGEEWPFAVPGVSTSQTSTQALCCSASEPAMGTLVPALGPHEEQPRSHTQTLSLPQTSAGGQWDQAEARQSGAHLRHEPGRPGRSPYLRRHVCPRLMGSVYSGHRSDSVDM